MRKLFLNLSYCHQRQISTDVVQSKFYSSSIWNVQMIFTNFPYVLNSVFFLLFGGIRLRVWTLVWLVWLRVVSDTMISSFLFSRYYVIISNSLPLFWWIQGGSRQRWIQDFQDAGANPKWGGTYYLAKFCSQLHQNFKKIELRGRQHVHTFFMEIRHC